jgi:hypothetical protein
MGREWQIGHDRDSEALQKGKPAVTDRRYLLLIDHSFTLDFIIAFERTDDAERVKGVLNKRF